MPLVVVQDCIIRISLSPSLSLSLVKEANPDGKTTWVRICSKSIQKSDLKQANLFKLAWICTAAQSWQWLGLLMRAHYFYHYYNIIYICGCFWNSWHDKCYFRIIMSKTTHPDPGTRQFKMQYGVHTGTSVFLSYHFKCVFFLSVLTKRNNWMETYTTLLLCSLEIVVNGCRQNENVQTADKTSQ